MSTMRGWGMLPCGLGMPQIISANRVFCSVVQLPLVRHAPHLILLHSPRLSVLTRCPLVW